MATPTHKKITEPNFIIFQLILVIPVLRLPNRIVSGITWARDYRIPDRIPLGIIFGNLGGEMTANRNCFGISSAIFLCVMVIKTGCFLGFWALENAQNDPKLPKIAWNRLKLPEIAWTGLNRLPKIARKLPEHCLKLPEKGPSQYTTKGWVFANLRKAWIVRLPRTRAAIRALPVLSSLLALWTVLPSRLQCFLRCANFNTHPFLCNELGPFQEFSGTFRQFQAICLGPFQVFSGNFRQF